MNFRKSLKFALQSSSYSPETYLKYCIFPPNYPEEVIGEIVVPPSKKLEDLIRLSELCVDLLRQNEEFYAEVRHSDASYSYYFIFVWETNGLKSSAKFCPWSPGLLNGWWNGLTDGSAYMCLKILRMTIDNGFFV